MVKRVEGLDRGPAVPRVFGGDFCDPRVCIGAGDEVRCARGRQEIYIGVFGVSTDGWLLGYVVNFGLWTGGTPFRIQVGELVQIRTDRVLAVLKSPAPSQRATPYNGESWRIMSRNPHGPQPLSESMTSSSLAAVLPE